MADRICRVCGGMFDDVTSKRGRPAKDCQTCRRVRATPHKPPRPVETMVCWCGVSFKGRNAKACLRHRRTARPYGLPALDGGAGDRQCPVCQRGYTVKLNRGRPRLYCSDWCAGYWPRMDGQKGKRPQTQRECVGCGATFIGTKQRRFCEKKCRLAHRPGDRPPACPFRDLDCLSCGSRFSTRSTERRRCFVCRPKRDRRGKTKAGDPRSTRAWRVLRAQVLAEESHCWICDAENDPRLRWPHRLSGSADHIVPVDDDQPETFFDRANVRAAHLTCNIVRGNKMQQAKKRAAIRKRRLANERLSDSDSERRLQEVA